MSAGDVKDLKTTGFISSPVKAIAMKTAAARGAQFLTPPQDRGAEIRCYLRDPDGHLIEVRQTVSAPIE